METSEDVDVDLNINLADVEFQTAGNGHVGSGAFGSVYRGVYKGQPVAVKLMNKTFAEVTADPKEMKTFHQEMKILSQIRHPNIVRFLGGCMLPPNICLVEELMECNLWQYIHDMGRVETLQEALRIIKAVAAGLTRLHPSIIHRDLKPQNILLNASTGEVKITDFGLARVKVNTYLPTQSVTAGTCAYMAPECFRGDKLTEKIDIYSMGIVAWECLTRQKPWDGMNNFAIIYKVAMDAARLELPPEPDLPPALAELVRDCWQDNPKQRPSAEDIIRRCDAIAREIGTDSGAKTPLGQVPAPLNAAHDA